MSSKTHTAAADRKKTTCGLKHTYGIRVVENPSCGACRRATPTKNVARIRRGNRWTGKVWK